MVHVNYQIPFKSEGVFLCPQQESNLHFRFRKSTTYPLDDEGEKTCWPTRVPQSGFEPELDRLEICCIIQLCYWGGFKKGMEIFFVVFLKEMFHQHLDVSRTISCNNASKKKIIETFFSFFSLSINIPISMDSSDGRTRTFNRLDISRELYHWATSPYKDPETGIEPATSCLRNRCSTN